MLKLKGTAKIAVGTLLPSIQGIACKQIPRPSLSLRGWHIVLKHNSFSLRWYFLGRFWTPLVLTWGRKCSNPSSSVST